MLNLGGHARIFFSLISVFLNSQWLMLRFMAMGAEELINAVPSIANEIKQKILYILKNPTTTDPPTGKASSKAGQSSKQQSFKKKITEEEASKANALLVSLAAPREVYQGSSSAASAKPVGGKSGKSGQELSVAVAEQALREVRMAGFV